MIKTKESSRSLDKLFDELTASACPDGKTYLSPMSHSLDTLVAACRRWPEYLYEQSGFALSLLRKYLDKPGRTYLAGNALYVDYNGQSETHRSPRVYFLGNSTSDLHTEDYAVATIYLFNRSKVTIVPGVNSILSVETYDDTQLHIEGGENARITVYKYDRSTVTGTARIKPKEYKREEVFKGKETGE